MPRSANLRFAAVKNIIEKATRIKDTAVIYSSIFNIAPAVFLCSQPQTLFNILGYTHIKLYSLWRCFQEVIIYFFLLLITYDLLYFKDP